MDLNTGNVITRQVVNEVPVTAAVVKAVEALAERDDVQSLKIMNRAGVVLHDTDLEYNTDEEDEDYDPDDNVKEDISLEAAEAEIDEALDEELERMSRVALTPRLMLPFFVLIVLLGGERLFPQYAPSLGMPLAFLIAAASGLSGKTGGAHAQKAHGPGEKGIEAGADRHREFETAGHAPADLDPLRREPDGGVEDVHFHPMESRSFRLIAEWRF